LDSPSVVTSGETISPMIGVKGLVDTVEKLTIIKLADEMLIMMIDG
jgi:hypothetical protein